jgi:hypothetical protein
VTAGRIAGDVLLNSTSIGMHPGEGETPVPKQALGGYRAVFDAVYTPLETMLLKASAPPLPPVIGAPAKGMRPMEGHAPAYTDSGRLQGRFWTLCAILHSRSGTIVRPFYDVRAGGAAVGARGTGPPSASTGGCSHAHTG